MTYTSIWFQNQIKSYSNTDFKIQYKTIFFYIDLLKIYNKSLFACNADHPLARFLLNKITNQVPKKAFFYNKVPFVRKG